MIPSICQYILRGACRTDPSSCWWWSRHLEAGLRPGVWSSLGFSVSLWSAGVWAGRLEPRRSSWRSSSMWKQPAVGEEEKSLKTWNLYSCSISIYSIYISCRERQTDRGKVDSEREDDEGHDPEHSLHGAQIGVINTRLCTQLKEIMWWLITVCFLSVKKTQ